MKPNRITTLDELFAEEEEANRKAYELWASDPIAQERLRQEVELRAAAAATEPDELDEEEEDSEEDEEEDEEEDD